MGTVSSGQARAITSVLEGISPQLNPAQQAQAESLLVGMADTLDSQALAKAAPRILTQVAPTDANELMETRLQRHPEQRRADALASLLRHAANAEPARGSGVGTAKIIVKLDYDRLQEAASGAGVIGDGVQLSAGELRRACCDAELVPVVLHGVSGVLDVGRARRLVTPAMRAALIVRDGGCVFPGCTAPPSACEAHHIVPWWAGGSTSLDNLASCQTAHLASEGCVLGGDGERLRITG